MGEHQAKPTSERVTVEAYQSTLGDYLIYLFHVATYEFARSYVKGRRVLDFGCGTGYGTHALASAATAIEGIDISTDAIAHARGHFEAENLTFRVVEPVDVKPLPFDDGSFDTVVSFQVIEHISGVDSYLDEIRRVLAPGGVLVCATPDRTTRLFQRQRPWNLHHVHEYAPNELEALLAGTFPVVEMFGMTAPEDLLRHELRRTHKLRLLTLPFTFPGAPEKVRAGGLGVMKWIEARRAPSAAETPGTAHDFGAEVIQIEPDAHPSVNIVAVARLR